MPSWPRIGDGLFRFAVEVLCTIAAWLPREIIFLPPFEFCICIDYTIGSSLYMPPDYSKGRSLAYLSIFYCAFGRIPVEEEDLGSSCLLLPTF